ncbi:MAG: TadE/TadG family type IV pilus assembly protein [Chloroflexi bacterium]|nr:TadE/TadG family type IV pilus assembly protein [Chloroflexota bacterium]MDA1003904.1 TadE/TadG family type IV pilus assembly protein [Chloroflexota bacterium]
MRTPTNDSGQAVVEFVLLFPVVLVLLLMIVEFGFALHTYVTVNNSAAEAARYAAVGSRINGGGACQSDPANPSIEGRAVVASAGEVSCADVRVTYRKLMPGGGYLRGDSVNVAITHEYLPITPLGELMSALSFGSLPATLTMRACADARLERAPASQAGLIPGTACS